MSVTENHKPTAETDGDVASAELGAAREVVALARNQIGVSDSPPGSNQNKFTTWFGVNTSWSAIFVSWLFAEAGKPELVQRTSSIADQGKWFQNRERWISRPRFGAIAYFDWSGDGTDFDHAGIVESVTSDTTFTTIEGNWNGGVRRVERDLTHVTGFGMPAYPVIVPGSLNGNAGEEALEKLSD